MTKKFLSNFQNYLILISRSKNYANLSLYLYYVTEVIKNGKEQEDGSWLGLAPSYQKINSAITLTNDTIRHCNSFLENIGLVEFSPVATGEKEIKLLPLKALSEDELNNLYKIVEIENTPIKDARLGKKFKSLTNLAYMRNLYKDLCEEGEATLVKVLQEFNVKKEDFTEEQFAEIKSVLSKAIHLAKEELDAREYNDRMSFQIKSQLEELINETRLTLPTKYDDDKIFGHFLIRFYKHFGFHFKLEIPNNQTYRETKEYRIVTSIIRHLKSFDIVAKYINWVFKEKVDEWKKFHITVLGHASLINEYLIDKYKDKGEDDELEDLYIEIIEKVSTKHQKKIKIKKKSQLKWFLSAEANGSIGACEREILKSLREVGLSC